MSPPLGLPEQQLSRNVWKNISNDDDDAVGHLKFDGLSAALHRRYLLLPKGLSL